MAKVELAEVEYRSPVVDRLLTEFTAELVATVPGFSPRGGSPVSDGDFVAPAGGFLVATVDGVAAGCGGIRLLSGTTGEVKRLFVRRAARGEGVGRALLAGLERLAHGLGFEALRLDTMGGEPAALALFRSRGWTGIPDYNGNSRARHWFEKRLSA